MYQPRQRRSMAEFRRSAEKRRPSLENSCSSQMTLGEKMMVAELRKWSKTARHASKSITGKGIATMVAKIVEHQRVTVEDEYIVMHTLVGQQSLWTIIVVVDSLILGMMFPLILNGDVNPRDADIFDPQTEEILAEIFNGFAVFTTFFICFHIVACVLFYALSCYLFDIESILWLFFKFQGSIAALNLCAFPITVATIVTAILGQILVWGPMKSLPAIVMGTFSIIGVLLFYLKVLKPAFNDELFQSTEGPWSRKTEKVATAGGKADCGRAGRGRGRGGRGGGRGGRGFHNRGRGRGQARRRGNDMHPHTDSNQSRSVHEFVPHASTEQSLQS